MAALVALPVAQLAGAPRHASRPAATRDWTRSVTMTPEGGFRMGNPAARVKLVEYGSLACPHCRHFEETGFKPLVDGYVRTGRVSYEFRNMLLNGPDIAVSLITRCAGAANFFPMAEAVFTRQPQWQQKIQQGFDGLNDAQKSEFQTMSDDQRILRFSELGGLDQLGTGFGVSPARARQCLADKGALKRLLGMTEAANKAGITHTPTFLINGKVTDAATWEQLQPLLRKAGAGG